MSTTTRTYYVSDSITVRRLDNLSGSWTSCTLPTNASYVDVMTDPTDPDKVFVIGGPYIYYSSDAGVSWNVPVGNYNSDPQIIFYEVWCIDPATIVVCASGGRVVISTDGGVTFNFTTTFPTPTGLVSSGSARAIHFISPLIGVVGYDMLVYVTINGGVTWTVTNSGLNIGTGPAQDQINAIHISADQQVITANTQRGIFRSTNGGLTYSTAYSWSNSQGRHMTWLNDNELWAVGLYSSRVKSIDAGATWVVQSDLFPAGLDDFAEHFYDSNNGFFNLSTNLYGTSDSGLTGSFADTNAFSVIFAVWTQLAPQICYLLQDCQGLIPSIVVSGIDLANRVGLVVNIPILGDKCWIVSIAPDCQNAIALNPNEVVTTYVDCQDCLAIPCYLVTECTGQVAPFTVSSNLASLVGRTINNLTTSEASYLPELCFTISVTDPCQSIVTVDSYSSIIYDDCECCQPQSPPPLPTPIKRVIPSPVKIFYQSKESLCDIQATEQFGEGYWLRVKEQKYGITSCCVGIDLEKLWLRKQLSDLSMMRDPAFCLLPSVNQCACKFNPCNSCGVQIRVCTPCSTCGPCNSLMPCSGPVQDPLVCP